MGERFCGQIPMRAAPETILLVEDDPGHAELIRANLEIGNLRQEIVHVTDGCQALDFLQRRGEFRSRPPGGVLVLLDLNIPRLDGLELLRQLKSHPETRATPVLVFAAGDNPRLIWQCYEAGCSLYFPKPSLFEDFIGTLERLTGLIQAVSVPISQ